MEIKYSFVYNIRTNTLLLKRPDTRKTRKIEKIMLETFAKKNNYKKKNINQRIELMLGETNQIYMIKKTDMLIFGLITTKMRTKMNLYKFLDEFYTMYQNENEMAINKWLKQQKEDFSKGKRLSVAQKMDLKIRRASQKLDLQIVKGVNTNLQLMQIDDEVKEVRKTARENRDLSKNIKNEAWWYNHKLMFFIWGGVGLLFVIFMTFVLGLFFK